MDEKIKVKNYILNTEKYENAYAVINKETGKEIFRISKKGNKIEDLQKMWPDLEVNNEMETKEDSKVIMPIKEDAVQVRKGLWYVDGSYFDEDGNEYVSEEEFIEQNN